MQRYVDMYKTKAIKAMHSMAHRAAYMNFAVTMSSFFQLLGMLEEDRRNAFFS